MTRLTRLAAVGLALFTCSASEILVAGPYGDDMAKCLVKSTSAEDRTALVKWIFSAMSLHPDLASMSSISAQQRDAMAQSAGALFQRLLFDSCKTETQDALQNEGVTTIQYAFQILGQVAIRGLMTDPHVIDGMKSVAKSLDEEKLKALVNPSTPK